MAGQGKLFSGELGYAIVRNRSDRQAQIATGVSTLRRRGRDPHRSALVPAARLGRRFEQAVGSERIAALAQVDLLSTFGRSPRRGGVDHCVLLGRQGDQAGRQETSSDKGEVTAGTRQLKVARFDLALLVPDERSQARDPEYVAGATVGKARIDKTSGASYLAPRTVCSSARHTNRRTPPQCFGNVQEPLTRTLPGAQVQP